MTYCVAMSLDEGMLFASDSRTNAGVDHVSTFSKMTVFEQPGERVIVVGAAVSPGSSALTAAIYSFRGDRICGAECHRHPADAFRRVDLEWSGLGAGSA